MVFTIELSDEEVQNVLVEEVVQEEIIAENVREEMRNDIDVLAILNFIKERRNKNTERKTEGVMRKFMQWLSKEKGEGRPID